MWHSWDHALVLFVAVAWPLYEYAVGYPRFKRAIASREPAVRVRGYLRTILTQWTLAALALFVWLHFDRPLAALGLGVPHGARFAAGAALGVVLAIAFAAQRRAIAARPEIYARVRGQL